MKPFKEWNTCKFDLCENWTYRSDADYCETHRRSNEKQKTDAQKQSEKRAKILEKAKSKAPRKPPKKVSDKRAELNEEYFKLVEQFKKDNPKCKANVNQYCTKSTDDPHHKKGRGVYLLDVSTWLPVCRSCHKYLEAHPKEAIEKGWSESRLATVKQTI